MRFTDGAIKPHLGISLPRMIAKLRSRCAPLAVLITVVARAVPRPPESWIVITFPNQTDILLQWSATLVAFCPAKCSPKTVENSAGNVRHLKTLGILHGRNKNSSALELRQRRLN